MLELTATSEDVNHATIRAQRLAQSFTYWAMPSGSPGRWLFLGRFDGELAPIPDDPDCYLINTTKTAKYDITVNGFKIHNGPAHFDVIGPGKRVELSIMRIMHPDDAVEVTWRQHRDFSDAPQTQEKTIPSRI